MRLFYKTGGHSVRGGRKSESAVIISREWAHTFVHTYTLMDVHAWTHEGGEGNSILSPESPAAVGTPPLFVRVDV